MSGDEPVSPNWQMVLASRSPRRHELLGHLISQERFRVLPPTDSTELEFDGLHQIHEIRGRLRQIALGKWHDVARQLTSETLEEPVARSTWILSADTTVVVGMGDNGVRALGSPADDVSGRAAVRDWFRNDYAGRTHRVLTAYCLGLADEAAPSRESLDETEVEFRSDAGDWVEWYLSTGEPFGKAGGYALQGAGSLFVSRVSGSLGNVVGLPLERLARDFRELGLLMP